MLLNMRHWLTLPENVRYYRNQGGRLNLTQSLLLLIGIHSDENISFSTYDTSVPTLSVCDEQKRNFAALLSPTLQRLSLLPVVRLCSVRSPSPVYCWLTTKQIFLNIRL